MSPPKAPKLSAAEEDDRLRSWKDIAAFLGCDERTARRREELGMPVHRIPGAKRSRIFASRAEISQWLSRRPDLEPPGAIESPIQSPAVAEARDGRASPRRGLYLAGALGCSVALLVLAAMALKRSITPDPPARVTFLGDSMRVLGDDGRLLWTHRFSGPLDPSVLPFGHKLESLVRVADLRGDGHREVVVVALVHASPNPNDLPHPEVDCFSESGVLLWSYVPRETFRFGNREYTGPWLPYAIQVSRRGPPLSLFVVFDHIPWGYSFVTEIDPSSGRGTVRFVNSGSVFQLEELHTSHGTFLLAGGFNNEFDGGSLAVFDETRSFAASPQTPGTRYACANCPAGNPDYYLVFPRSEINRRRRVYLTPIVGMSVNAAEVEVTKLELLPNIDVTTRYLFQTDLTLQLLSLRYDSRYEMVHKELEQNGELDHSLAKCPERLHPLPVRVWTPSEGWMEWDVKPVVP